MISLLENKKQVISQSIYKVFQASYKIEAELLNAVDFPPLKRTVKDFINSNTQFYGYFINDILGGIIELKIEHDFIHIQSLVVHPNNFRQGIAIKLMSFTLNNFDCNKFKVETGLLNSPAIKLYKKFGFKETKQWDTSFGIRKIELKLNR